MTEQRLTELEVRSDAGELLPYEVPALLAEIRRLRFHLREAAPRLLAAGRSAQAQIPQLIADLLATGRADSKFLGALRNLLAEITGAVAAALGDEEEE